MDILLVAQFFFLSMSCLFQLINMEETLFKEARDRTFWKIKLSNLMKNKTKLKLCYKQKQFTQHLSVWRLLRTATFSRNFLTTLSLHYKRFWGTCLSLWQKFPVQKREIKNMYANHKFSLSWKIELQVKEK